jgi:uncharacterized membrane protein
LDASGTTGLVIDNLLVAWLRAAASTQTFDAFHVMLKHFMSSVTCLVLFSSLVLGQTPGTARINGTVVDSMGAAISKVRITASNSAASFTAVSDEQGNFTIDLPAGTYQMRSDKVPGFTTTNRTLVVETGKTADVTVVPAINLEDAICILRIEGRPLAKRPKRKRHR